LISYTYFIGVFTGSITSAATATKSSAILTVGFPEFMISAAPHTCVGGSVTIIGDMVGFGLGRSVGVLVGGPMHVSNLYSNLYPQQSSSFVHVG